MRGFVLRLFMIMAVFVPIVGSAQVGSIQPTPLPQISAASAPWFLRGEPIFFAGNLYYPTGPSVYFDGYAMTQSITYQGVPLYNDLSREPYSVVLVPIGGNLMRPYVRRAETGVSGTIGFLPPQSRATRPGDVTAAVGTTPVVALAVGDTQVPSAARPVGTGGTIVPAQPTRVRVGTIPEARTNLQGVWIEFDGARWYHNGAVTSYNPDRFLPVGSYRGFPVYKDKTDASDTIYVSVVQDGPLAPYSKH